MMIRKVLMLLAAVVALLLAVMVIRAVQFPAPVPRPDVTEPVVFPGRPDDTSDPATRLSQALQIPTVSYRERERMDAEAFAQLNAFLEANYPLVFAQLDVAFINDHSLLITWPGSDPALKPALLMSHTDVVPVNENDLDKWTHPPFSGAMVDGYIWGRGALDDKAGVLGILEVAEALLAQDFQPKQTLYFAFGADEEIGGELGAESIAQKLQDQHVRLDFVLDEGGAIVDGQLPGVESLVALIGVAEKGYVSLKLTATGAGGHTSMPPASTAVGQLSRAVVKLEEHPFPPDFTFLSDLMRYVGEAAPFTQRLVFANQWLTAPLLDVIAKGSPGTNAIVRTTTAATMMTGSPKDNVLPTEASAVINFRILPGDTTESVKARAEAIIDDPEIQVEFYSFGDNPSPVSPTDAPFERIAAAVYAVAGDRDLVVAPFLTVGATDARHYTEISDHVYRFFPAVFSREDLSLLHGIDERISVANYELLLSFYFELIRGL